MTLYTRLVPESLSLLNKLFYYSTPCPVIVRECPSHHHLAHSAEEEEKPEESDKVEKLKPGVDRAWTVLVEDALGLWARRAAQERAWVALVAVKQSAPGLMESDVRTPSLSA